MDNTLSKSLSSLQLWGIIVGTVISGMYFGWNYALQYTGTVGFIIAVTIVSLFYISFIFSFAELSTAIPNAGGSSEYASRTMGPFGGFIAGFSCIVEFLFAVPAIALSIGAYINFLVPGIPAIAAAAICYIIFVFINLLGLKIAAAVELIAAVVAIAGIILFILGGSAKVNLNNFFASNSFSGGLSGIFAAIPFALWFYMGVEGGAMASEECKNPQRDIPKGFILGVVTIGILSIITLVVATGIADSSRINSVDSPLPTALALALGDNNILSKLLSLIGVFGLIASLHGVIIGYSRQVFAMARSGYFPGFLSRTSEKHKTPLFAIIFPSLIGLIFVLTGATSVIIVISAMGAVIMYFMSMVSLFLLRKKEPRLQRPYKVAYPLLPAIALVLPVVFFVTIAYQNMSTVLWVLLTYACASIFYLIYSKGNVFKINLPVLDNSQVGIKAE